MLRLIFSVTFCLTIAFCFGQSQSDLNEEAAKNYQKADKELNSTYQEILKEYHEDTIFIKNLQAAQKIWIQFRDAEMKAKYPDREVGYYGSVQPMCWSMYMTDLTNDRTKDLKVWLSGIEEGDVCTGSVKIKTNK
jgi:uncharacterized protein YecT (DUF1311 family)